MEISSRRKVWIFLLVLLMTCACKDANKDNVNDTEILSSVLFAPEDLDGGWYADTYFQHSEPQDFISAVPSVEKVAAIIQAEPGSFEGRYQTQLSRFHATQGLFIYQNEEEARLAVENARQFLAPGQIEIRSSDIVYAPQMEIVKARCTRVQGLEIGPFDGCSITIQHGRYITNATMNVDGELITMEDWYDFINAIQVRLIEQVAKENEE